MANNKKYILLVLLGVLIAIGFVVANRLRAVVEKTPGTIHSTQHATQKNKTNKLISTNKNSTSSRSTSEMDSGFIKAATVDSSSLVELLRLSEPPSASNSSNLNLSKNKNIEYKLDTLAGASSKTTFTGRRINIAITGIDGRVGSISRHADANHVISILTETGEIEITSIPRDTYCDLGYEDSTGLNKLTICRSNKGRNKYLQELARISRLDKIHYYVEFGFSQAMGIIEWLGYKNPANTLQVLRSRKGFGDDYQRCYNQGQFIRQALLAHFDKFTGTFGSVFIRGGLLFVETNLTTSIITNIISKLETTNFSQDPEKIIVRVRPPIKIKFKNYDFTQQETVDELSNKIENFNRPRFDKLIDSPQPKVNVANKLNGVIAQAAKDSARRPAQVISKLSAYFEQRAWYQVDDKFERDKIRDAFCTMLQNAYLKRGNLDKASAIKEIIESEKLLFDGKFNYK